MWAAAVAAALGLFALAAPAAAHAVLVRSDPGAGQTIATAPTKVSLWFSEPVEVARDGVQVLDATGARRDLENAALSPEDVQQVQVSLKPLENGVYTVRWRITSIDTHVVSGSFQFGVNAAVSNGGAQAVTTTASPVEAALRWLSLGALSLLVGGFWFRQFVLRPALDPPPPLRDAQATLLRWMRASALALLLLNLVWLGYQIVLVTEGGIGALFDPVAISRVVMRSRFGTVWLGRMVCVIALLGIVDQLEAQHRADPRGGGLWWWLGMVVGAGLALTATLLGHAAAEQHVWLAVPADWLHLTATAVWLGGLAYLMVLGGGAARSAPPGQRLAALAALWPPFSRLAVMSVQVLVATGLVSAWLMLGRVDFFTTSDYGRVLMTKLAMVVPLLLIGAVNLLRYGPWFDRGRSAMAATGVADGLVRRATTSLRAEVVLGVAVLALAGVLGATPPPYDAGAAAAAGSNPAGASAAQPQGVSLAQGATTSLVVLQLSPAAVGPNNLRVQVRDALGAEVVGAAVQVRVGAEGSSGTSLVTLEAVDGAYRGVVQLPEPAEWTFDVRVAGPGRPEESAAFTLRVPLPTPRERLLRAQAAMNRLTAVKERQVLRGATGTAVTYEYRYEAPGSLAATGSDGSEVVLIGRDRYTRSGDAWTKVETPAELAYRFPDYDFTTGVDRVTELGAEMVDGVPTDVVAFEQGSTGFFYRLWLDGQDRVRRIKMMGPGHFMDATLYDFDVPNGITPPAA